MRLHAKYWIFCILSFAFIGTFFSHTHVLAGGKAKPNSEVKTQSGKLPEEVTTLILSQKKMAVLSGMEIQSLLKHQLELRAFLLDRILRNDLTTLRNLILAKKEKKALNPKQAFLAASVVNYVINYDTAGSAVMTASEWAAKNAVKNLKSKDAAGSSAWTAAQHSDWKTAFESGPSAGDREAAPQLDDALKENMNAVASVVGNSARKTIYHALFNSAKDDTKSALSKLNLSVPDETGKTAFQLAELAVLRGLAQNNTDYFTNLFNLAYENFNPSLNLDQAKRMIHFQLEQSPLPQNPFIQHNQAFHRELTKLLQ